MRRVTGGLLVAVLLVIELLMSWREDHRRRLRKYETGYFIAVRRLISNAVSSSNLFQFLDDHGEGFKNRGGGSGEGYDPLRTVPL